MFKFTHTSSPYLPIITSNELNFYTLSAPIFSACKRPFLTFYPPKSLKYCGYINKILYSNTPFEQLIILIIARIECSGNHIEMGAFNSICKWLKCVAHIIQQPSKRCLVNIILRKYTVHVHTSCTHCHHHS